jgi:CBS domain containing-hemolysin-like protein
MQRQKQHMSIVIDEYGSVAGLVTIEDLLEAIVGNIEDEHDTDAEELPLHENDGSWIVPGGFDTARLRELFTRAEAAPEVIYDGENDDEAEREAEAAEQALAALLAEHEAATIGGLVSEIAGHIPLPGEVVEQGPLRIEVLASTDRRIDRVRLRLLPDLSNPSAL